MGIQNIVSKLFKGQPCLRSQYYKTGHALFHPDLELHDLVQILQNLLIPDLKYAGL